MRGARAIVLAILLGACTPRIAPPPPGIEPGTTFAAHRVHGGYAIDRLENGRNGMIEATGWRPWSDGPGFLVEADGYTVAALGQPSTAVVGVRTTPSAPVVATVEPSWDNQAIRLTVNTADGTAFRTGPFQRLSGSGDSVLRRTALTNLDVRGTYRAELLDAAGHPVGWFQVNEWEPYSPRLFQGVLPPGVPAAGPALTVAVGSELDWIDQHTLDVYRGGSGNRQDESGRGGGK
jgi:hypothetical protein